jgi:hypothetical protein
VRFPVNVTQPSYQISTNHPALVPNTQILLVSKLVDDSYKPLYGKWIHNIHSTWIFTTIIELSDRDGNFEKCLKMSHQDITNAISHNQIETLPDSLHPVGSYPSFDIEATSISKCHDCPAHAYSHFCVKTRLYLFLNIC